MNIISLKVAALKRDRLICKYYFSLGYSMTEIAKLLHHSSHTVMKAIHRKLKGRTQRSKTKKL